jgi:sporulation protein YlmC with PRC-barrel domain
VASEDRLRELEDKYEGYRVYDNRGERIGKVDDLFIDEADREEYIGVKMGFFGRKSTLIPMDIVRVNEADRAIEVSEAKDHVKDAPSFDDDEDITPEYEDRIRSHFGLESLGSSHTRGSYGAHSDARDEERERGYSDRDDRADHVSSADTGYDERTGSSAGGAAERFERTGSTSDRETSEPPATRETETFEEGGRAKVRRRIIREEIVEEDPNDRSS